jgi:hypothetical protein
MRIIWMWFLARFHLSDAAVCEMSKGKGTHNDYHNYQDSSDNMPLHFHTYQCKRCGKEFCI